MRPSIRALDFDWASLRSSRSLIPDADDENERTLVRFAVTELPQVMRVRLLGRDPELFGAVDRMRAEVDFRLAVIPPMLGLAAAATVRLGAPAAAIAVAVAVVMAAGLFIDALERQREANDVLVEALADGRVKAPTLEWVENEAASIGSQQKTHAMRTAAAEFDKPLEDSLQRLKSRAPQRELTRVTAAAALARTKLYAIQAMFSPATAAAAGDSVVAVERAIEMWNTGAQPPFEEWRSELALTLDVAEESRLDFRRLALDEVAAVAERAVPETDAHEPGTRAGVTAAEG